MRVHGDVDELALERLRKGVMLEDGEARFSDVQYYGGEGTNRWYHVTLMEGRNREVRRLWESQSLEVSRLKRVRFGPLVLPSTVPAGRWMELFPQEIEALYRMLKLPIPSIEGKRGRLGKSRCSYPILGWFRPARSQFRPSMALASRRGAGSLGGTKAPQVSRKEVLGDREAHGVFPGNA